MKVLLKKIRHSLAIRLLLLSLGTIFAIMLVVSLIMAAGFKGQFNEFILPHAQHYHEYLIAELGEPPSREKALELTERLPLEIHIIDASGEWSSSGNALNTSQEEHWRRGKDHKRYIEHNRRFLIQSAVSDAQIYLSFSGWQRSDKGKHLMLTLVFIILLLAYFAIRHLFKPLDAIKQGVKQFSEGDLEHRISVKRKDELGDLANQVNTLAADISGMLDAKRDLLLAISHELRSPITRSKVSLELMEPSEFSVSVKNDLLEMETLISEILESERMNQRHAVLNPVHVDMAVLIGELQQELDPKHELLSTSLNLKNPVWLLDRPRIRLLLHNLLDNALRHNHPEQGQVELRLEEQSKGLVVHISDHGDGISTEHLPHLTEPFYRVDPSRQRKTGGYGLGLYLCKAIVEAHGGELKITSGSSTSGTTVTAVLPCEVAAKT